MLNTLIEKAEKEIQRTVKYLKENEHIFERMTLKLYEASYYAYNVSKEDYPKLCYIRDNINRDVFNDLFTIFCDENYELLCLSTDFEKQAKYIGRTSSFNLINSYSNNLCTDIIGINRYDDLYVYDTIYNIIRAYDCDWIDDIDENGKFIIDLKDTYYYTIEEKINNFIKDLEWIIKYLYDYTVDLIEPIKETYEYINEFKDNQVEYFKDYLINFEEEAEIYTETVERYRF